MPLKTFFFPIPETRFFRGGSLFYKFKIRGGSRYSGMDVTSGSFDQELEEIIRTVLGNLDSLQPFSSTHFIIFPYKQPWKGASQLMCRHRARDLRAYPFTLVLYLVKNTQNGEQEHEPNPEPGCAPFRPPPSEPPPKRRRSYSPLEEAILKDLMPELVAESRASGAWVRMDNPHAEGDVKEDPGHVDKRGRTLYDEAEGVSGVNKSRGSPGDVPAGTTEDMEEGGEEEGDTQEDSSVPASPARPGILTQIARRIFPFSLLFRDT